MSEPRISVVLPNYNHARFLPQCLEGLLDQRVLPSEVIVVDDASLDNSLEILRGYAKKYPLLQVHSNEQNLGVVRTMNRGMALASGDYVLFAAADDQLKPGIFEHLRRMIQAHPEAGLCGGICEWRCATTGLTWYFGGSMPKAECYLNPTQMIHLSRKGRLALSSQNSAFRKSALLEAGGWRPELRWFTDCFGTYVVGFRYGVCHVPEVLSIFNLHQNSYYNSAVQAERRLVAGRFLELLETPAFADVAPRIRQSGILGSLGWPVLRATLTQRHHLQFLNRAFLKLAVRRGAEVAGRRCFPNWLARFCFRLFYRRD